MLAAGPVAQEAGIPFLDVGGTAPLITTVGDFIFMLPFGDNVQAAVAAEFVDGKGWATAALLLDEGMDYTKFLAQYFSDRFTMEDIGGEIVSELSYATGDTDFSSQLTEFKNLDPQPDFLFISADPGEIGTIVRAGSRPRPGDCRSSAATVMTRRCWRSWAGTRRRTSTSRLTRGSTARRRSRQPSTRPTKPSTAIRRKGSSQLSVMTASS